MNNLEFKNYVTKAFNFKELSFDVTPVLAAMLIAEAIIYLADRLFDAIEIASNRMLK